MKTALVFSVVVVVGFLVVGPVHAQTDPTGLWTDVAPAAITGQPQFDLLPAQFRAVRLDQDALLALVGQAPLERTPGAETANVILYLPLPDGAYGRFRIVESPVMAPELAAKFPDIKTYAGQGLDDPTATVRLDWTPHGFHGMILSASETVFIDPFSKGDLVHYISYFKRDARRSTPLPFNNPDFIDNDGTGKQIDDLLAQGGAASSGSQLRTYRTVVAATGEYTAFHGGTVALSQAAIVTAMNRVNGVYERDVAIRMTLVANNDQVVFTNAATDPYSNFDGDAMLEENQTTVDNIIGSPNYDIGHVFSTGGGGIAYLGVVCWAPDKAKGVTGLSDPIGDTFYIDYVSHEIGHQFSARHTFNSNAGFCGSPFQYSPATAYEPGSATTIMGYAGICSPQNIQPNSDDHFHTISFDEIVAYSTTPGPNFGNDCAAITATGNDPPVPNAGTGGFSIPINTPFSLIGSATDPNGDPMTYNWEEFDLGPAGHPNSPVNDAPIFRSFPSQPIPERIFPQISDIVNNTQTLGEILPSYSRSLTFRLTVRDNQFGGGGVDHDQIAFNVDAGAGPFLVTGPNTAVPWTGNTSETVTWNVANTNAPPVSASTVNILLSEDGGFTYPHTLATGVANDGSESITVPNISTTMARVKVEAATNIFFDISNANFTIVPGAGPVTRYVAPGGNDGGGTNDCTNQASPCLTVTHAVDQASNGDTISMVAGMYDEVASLLIEKNLTLIKEGGGAGAVVK